MYVLAELVYIVIMIWIEHMIYMYDYMYDYM